MEAAYAAGLIVSTAAPGGVPRYKRYLDDMPGDAARDVWTDIPPVNSQATERIGYPTQKPLAAAGADHQGQQRPGRYRPGRLLWLRDGPGRGPEPRPAMDRHRHLADRMPGHGGAAGGRLQAAREARTSPSATCPQRTKFLRRIPHFEFENWAVVALGGIPNRPRSGDKGIDGRIYPVSADPEKRPKGKLGFMDHWYPIQVKQKDKAGRPDIDAFEAVMMREDRTKGFFVSFDYTADAEDGDPGVLRRTGKAIVALTVQRDPRRGDRHEAGVGSIGSPSVRPPSLPVADRLRRTTRQGIIGPSAKVPPPENRPVEFFVLVLIVEIVFGCIGAWVSGEKGRSHSEGFCSGSSSARSDWYLRR